MSLSTCLVCGGQYNRSALPGLLECGLCGFTTADLFLGPKELASLYTERYFKGEEYRDYVAERNAIEKQFKARLRRLLRFVSDPASKHLFEIGSAYGFFLSVAKNVFRSVAGIDISEDAAKYARDVLDLPVRTADFLDVNDLRSVDILCLWDTIEHLQSPHLYIEKAADLMRPGGTIAITTGDIGSVLARIRGAKWRQIHPPTHLHYFSRNTLTKLLDSKGFTIQHCGYEGMYRTLDMIAYIVLTIKNDRPAVYRLLKKSGLLRFSVYLNLYDILFCVAKRR